MHFLFYITSLLFLLSNVLAGPVRPQPSRPPQNPLPTFTRIFDGALTLGSFDGNLASANATFGTRTLVPFTGGNLTDPKSGKVVAKVLSGIGGELGVIATNGALYADAKIGFQWVDDGKFGLLETHGVGAFRQANNPSTVYARLETDSPSREELNRAFLLVNVAFDSNPPSIAVFRMNPYGQR